MPRSVKYIQLDLNNPVFQESWFTLEPLEAERVRAALNKIHKLTWDVFHKYPGFKWEKIQSIRPPDGVDAVYTFRVTQSVRGVGFREGNYLRLLLIEPDHDAAYGKK